MKVAVYKRVSTVHQTTDNQDIDIENWLKTNNVSSENVVYFEEQESAWHANHQKELARLTEEIESGKRKYDVLLVWSLDRLTRQGIGYLFGLLDSLKVRGCRVVSTKEWFTQVADDRMSQLYYAMIGWAAEFESHRKSERIIAMHKRLKAEGRHSGRPKGKKDKNPNGRRKGGYFQRWQRNK